MCKREVNTKISKKFVRTFHTAYRYTLLILFFQGSERQRSSSPSSIEILQLGGTGSGTAEESSNSSIAALEQGMQPLS